jgi:sugar phosphate isomerase/epimerase
MTRLALQLYTVRDECAADLSAALETTASLGFDGVELHDLHGHSTADARALLDANGLVVCARHVMLAAVEGDLDALADEVRTLGTDRVVVAWIEPPTTAAAADAAAERLQAAADGVAAVGLRLGFHNHAAEVEVLEDGRTLLDRLLAADGPFLELDLGWAWYAGVDPLTLLARAQGRVPLVHVKDMRRNGAALHVPLGDGAVDYAGLWDASKRAGVEWLIVEQDETDGPPFAAVARSLERLRSLVRVGV